MFALLTGWQSIVVLTLHSLESPALSLRFAAFDSLIHLLLLLSRSSLTFSKSKLLYNFAKILVSDLLSFMSDHCYKFVRAVFFCSFRCSTGSSGCCLICCFSSNAHGNWVNKICNFNFSSFLIPCVFALRLLCRFLSDSFRPCIRTV